jgi:Fic family protein
VEDAVAALDREPALTASEEAAAALAGYRSAITFVQRKSEDPFFSFSTELLKSLHFLVTEHDGDAGAAKWRPGASSLRHEASGETIYAGPPLDALPRLVEALIEDLGAKSPAVPGAVRAAMAHLNVVMIRPFDGGNGRVARLLQTLVLARQTSAVPYPGIEEYLGKNRQDYYQVLAEVGGHSWHPDRSPRTWIRFCLTAHYRQAMTLLRRARELQRLCDELEVLVQRAGLPERCVLALGDAAYGGRLRNPIYRRIAELSEVVAGRDLKAMAEAGLLESRGEKRGRYYLASPTLAALRRHVAEPKTIASPFLPTTSATAPSNLLLPGMEETA